LPLAITMTIYGYHFQKIAAQALQANPVWIEKVQKARQIRTQALMEPGD